MSRLKYIIPYIVYLGLVVWALKDGFFWDSVQLGSKHAHFYFDNNLALAFLPDEINSGHIPLFGYYLALVWKLFGKSLLVSHLAMAPFVFGIVFFVIKLCSIRIKEAWLFLAVCVILSDPTLVAQIGLMGPDLPLICFFLACLFYHSKRRSVSKSIFLLLLVMISMRGMFLVLSFFLFDFMIEKRKLQDLVKTYLPSVLVVVLFFIFHYIYKGWVGFHSDSPWSQSFSIDNVNSILKKPFIIVWRLIDFNRWFVFLVTFILGFRMFKADKKLYLITSELYLLGIIAVIFGIVGSLFSGLTAHRYFLPINILVVLYFLRMVLLSDFKERTKKTIIVSTIIILWLGHLLIYPAQIDQGWDASLAHKPYFYLRSEADDYLVKNGIDKVQVCTAFPDLAQGKFYALNGDESSFSRLSSNACEYVLISNIHNDIEPKDFEGKEVVMEWKRNRIWYRLLRL